MPQAAPAEPRISAAERREQLRAERERQQAELKKREGIYVAPTPAPMQNMNQNAGPAPRIAVFKSDKAEKGDKALDRLANIPDVQVPAGSILSAMMITGLDAPTGTRATQEPVPVLMRIKPEAILPNYALADVRDCHLLGSAYGDLGSERVNIRGETVSCVLRDNTAVEGKVKFFVAGDDGKNGIKGHLVARSGRMLAAAAGAALTQGLMGALQNSTSSTDSLVISGGASSAVSGASKGFDLLTEYYIDLAEQTFPVIEVPNGRWVDVVLTEMLTIKWKG